MKPQSRSYKKTWWKYSLRRDTLPSRTPPRAPPRTRSWRHVYITGQTHLVTHVIRHNAKTELSRVRGGLGEDVLRGETHNFTSFYAIKSILGALKSARAVVFMYTFTH